MKWLEIAQNLPMGHNTRQNCECGDGKTLVINNNAKGYSCHCFRCDVNEFEPKGQQTLAALNHIRELNEAALKVNLKLELPNDFTNDIPLHGRLWLYAGGIAESTWNKYNIGYSPAMDRVVLPVYNREGKLVWYQCRALYKGQKPKYLQPSLQRDAVLFRANEGEGSDNDAVIVEDILSAIRVGKHILTYSLLGTKITNTQASVIGKSDRVRIWLDPDRAGRTGSYNIRKTLGLITEVTTISTTKDPKELSDQEIEEILCT
tara:strand:- start:15569 stop:16351 length:783 start_codon:yes stop_codon:yes gene_type:complete